MANITIDGLTNKATPVSTDQIELQATAAGASNKATLANVTKALSAATGAVQGVMSAADKTKLTGIETSATADQTGAEIKTAYELEADTNAYDDTAVTKLAGIEALADVTDVTNVTAAGALMDSEIDADLKTFALPASTTISTFGATLVDDADAATARATLSAMSLSAAWNVQTGITYTIAASDNGKIIGCNNAAAIAVTLPDTLATDFQCTIVQLGAGVPTVTPNTDTINGAGTGVTPSAQYKAMYLSQYAATTWVAVL